MITEETIKSIRAVSNSARIVADEAIGTAKRATTISIIALSIAAFSAGLNKFGKK